jgi:hypothetical protein
MDEFVVPGIQGHMAWCSANGIKDKNIPGLAVLAGIFLPIPI